MMIRTERLTLKPHGTEYIDTTHAYSSDIENTQLMMFLPNDSREETMEFLMDCERQWRMQRPDYLEFAVLLDGVHIGAVGIYRCDDPDTWEFGWIIDKHHWGRGYAFEAARAIAAAGAEHYGAKRYIAHCDSENKGSARVMEKLGMRLSEVHDGRKNRSSDEERKEFLYEMAADALK